MQKSERDKDSWEHLVHGVKIGEASWDETGARADTAAHSIPAFVLFSSPTQQKSTASIIFVYKVQIYFRTLNKNVFFTHSYELLNYVFLLYLRIWQWDFEYCYHGEEVFLHFYSKHDQYIVDKLTVACMTDLW